MTSNDELVGSILAAIEETSGRHFITGGAGTGKTTAALRLADGYLDRQDEPTRVLFLTFSRTAVAQIEAREPQLRARWGARIEVTTFHGLAFRLLQNFGRYNGLKAISVLSESRRRVLGDDGSSLPYDSLIPSAIQLLARLASLRAIVQRRWPLLIVDESQDCGTQHWDLIEALGIPRQVFLADPYQMIYRFVPGVSHERFQQALDAAKSHFPMPAASHRDPSGVIPALAAAARQRDFDHEVFATALRDQRFRVLADIEEDVSGVLLTEIRAARARRHTVGVFVQTNASVMQLAGMLDTAGIPHTIVGLPESHSEALGAIAAMVRYAYGSCGEDAVREGIAVFLASCVRGDTPTVSTNLIQNRRLEFGLEERLNEGLAALRAASSDSLEPVLQAAFDMWRRLSIAGSGPQRTWSRAAQHIERLSRRKPGSDPLTRVNELEQELRFARDSALVDLTWEPSSSLLVMNFHQTKGREVDEAILAFHDFRSREAEPFADGSLLLNVAMSRAKQRVTMLLPPGAHPLVAPLTAYRTQE